MGVPTRRGDKPRERQTSSGHVEGKSPPFSEAHKMETEILGIILGAVLPIYPLLFVIYQKIGRYDEIVEEFKKLRYEHYRLREAYHGG